MKYERGLLPTKLQIILTTAVNQMQFRNTRLFGPVTEILFNIQNTSAGMKSVLTVAEGRESGNEDGVKNYPHWFYSEYRKEYHGKFSTDYSSGERCYC